MKFILLILCALLLPLVALAQDVSFEQFGLQFFDLLKQFGGLSFVAKISAISALILSSIKVTFIRSYIWDKLGSAKILAPFILSLIIGLLSLEKISISGVLVYIFAGYGSVIIHEFIDASKNIPGYGPFAKKIIEIFEFVFKAPIKK